jgi:hypothetical protein
MMDSEELDFDFGFGDEIIEAPKVPPEEEVTEALQVALQCLSFDSDSPKNLRFNAAIYEYYLGAWNITDENVPEVLCDQKLLYLLDYAFQHVVDILALFGLHMLEPQRRARRLVQEAKNSSLPELPEELSKQLDDIAALEDGWSKEEEDGGWSEDDAVSPETIMFTRHVTRSLLYEWLLLGNPEGVAEPFGLGIKIPMRFTCSQGGCISLDLFGADISVDIGDIHVYIYEACNHFIPSHHKYDATNYDSPTNRELIEFIRDAVEKRLKSAR